jgi:flagellin-like hook-associated protein FlgL
MIPASTSRVPFSLSTLLAVENINTRQRELSRVSNELATGRRLNLPSDDPADAIRATLLQRSNEEKEQYRRNVIQGSTAIANVDASLRSFSDAIDSARSLSVALVDGTRDIAERAAGGIQVNALIDQLLNESNRKFLDNYPFASGDPSKLPFRKVGNFIEYTGSPADLLQSLQGSAELFPIAVPANFAVGVFSQAGEGTPLTPDLAGATRLRDLNSGEGIEPGLIEIDTGSGPAVLVDLSTADSIQDVVDIVNNDPTLSGLSFTIGLAANGRSLAVTAGPTTSVTIRNVDGGTTASDLGLNVVNLTIPGVGSDLQPVVTAATPLSLLNNGAGVDTSQPLVITNGPYSASIDLSGTTTVQEVLNRINTAGVYVRASINEQGTGINVLNSLSGSAFSIVENSQTGAVAQGLGILTTNLSTNLADFNDTSGVNLRDGKDIEIFVADGSVFQIDLEGALTVNDVKQIIESQTGGKATVSINPQGGLAITDTTSGTNAFTVQNIDDSQAASDLGIAGTTAGGGTILGTNAHQARVKGIFDTLIRIAGGLSDNDIPQVNLALEQLEGDETRLGYVRGSIGAVLQTLDATRAALTADITRGTEEASFLVDADLSETTTKLALQQVALQAALASGGRLLQGSLLDYL